jgi:predicted dehydrogenase
VTPTLRCALVGAGGARAVGHAEAYRYIARGRLVAACGRRRDAVAAFADRFGIEGRYTDVREMLERERPDVLHVTTPPHVRLEVLRAAQAAGVAGAIVEKPLGVQGEDFLEIEAFAPTCTIKVAVNHQLHFHPRRTVLQRAVREGAIGEVRLVEASARHNVAYQGTHALEAIRAFTPGLAPLSLFAQASGAVGLRGEAHHHPAPDHLLAEITFEGGVRGLLRCGDRAPAAAGAGPDVHLHKRVAVHGTRGFAHWTMHGWELNADGELRSGRHDYAEEDVRGQTRLTEAMFDWLADDTAVHPLSLDRALEDLGLVLAAYASALERRPCALPMRPTPELIARLREALG